MKPRTFGLPVLLVLVLLGSAPVFGADATLQAAAPDSQAAGPVAQTARQPLDIMLVIDNSCSMFPADRRIPGCEVWGNDPDFLRITGASLFIARLGFAQPDAADYQVGVVSLGEDPPALVSPLQSLATGRDALAAAISDPQPALATQLLPALELAYRELRESPQRRPGNSPAIVLLTDGAPYPAEGQSNAEIEQFVASYPDVPLFVILLQNPEQANVNYERYVSFWQEMALRHSYIQSYPVGSTAEIEATYDEIVARLENSVARPPIALTPGQAVDVFVSRYVQRMVLTFTRERGTPPANIQIVDPAGAAVADGDADVERFRGADNPVEVVAIGRVRLDAAPRDAVWRITSDQPVWMHLDMEGSYRIQFVEPAASVTAIAGQYLANRPLPPGRPVTFRLRLADNASGAAITEPQPIRARVTHPDGSTAAIPVPAGVQPDADGAYTLSYDLASTYAAADEPGRYAFAFEAGEIEGIAGDVFPIARAELLVDLRQSAYVASVTPEVLQCMPGQPAELTVTVGDPAAAQAGSLRISAFGGGREVALAPSADGATFSAPVTSLCEALIATLVCGAESNAAVRVRLVAVNADGSAAAPVELDVPARVVAPACTPTPTLTPTLTPVPTATPTPAPTPIPDTDGDGFNDLDDECVEGRGWSVVPFFRGCPPPVYAQIAGGLAGLGLLAFLGFYVVPLALVLTVNPPPGGYVQVYRNGKAEGGYKSLRSLGQSARKSAVTIGSQGLLRVAGLEPVELRVERRGGKGVVLKGAHGPQLFTIREIPATHIAAGGQVVLRFSTDPKQLGR